MMTGGFSVDKVKEEFIVIGEKEAKLYFFS